MNPYESDRLLAEYLLFHYGAPAEIAEGAPFEFPAESLEFPRNCVSLFGPLQPGSRALDVGCAVGRASFELSAGCAEVIGIDYSENFIRAAEAIQTRGAIAYEKVEQGERTSGSMAACPAHAHPGRVRFEHGDAHALREGLGQFDYLLGANLLCRLRQPDCFLAQVPALVRPGGRMVLTTPCSWLEEYTPRSNWLARDGRDTLEALRQTLAGQFTLLQTTNMPFVIREHARKFQCVNAQASLWERRA